MGRLISKADILTANGEVAPWKNGLNRRRSLRMIAGYTQAGGTGYTYQTAVSAEADYVAVRLVLLNVQNSSIDVNCCIAPSSTPAGSNPTGSWVTVTKDGSSTITLPAGDGVRRPSITVTDWMPIISVSRSDGGTIPILFARLYSASQVYVTGNTSSTDGSEWGTISGTVGKGRVIYDSAASGDFVTTNQASYVATTSYQGAILGFEFLHETDVLTVMTLGDSQHQGDGGSSSKLLGPIVRAAIASSVTGSKPVQYSNYGYSSDLTSGFLGRLTDLFEAGLRPNVIVTTPWSTNDLTVSSVDFFHFALGRMRDNAMEMNNLCHRYGSKLVWTNCIPLVLAENRDSLRRAYNTEVAAVASAYGIDLIDWDTAVKAGTTPDTIVSGSTTDNLHLNDNGLALAATASQTTIDAIRDDFFS